MKRKRILVLNLFAGFLRAAVVAVAACGWAADATAAGDWTNTASMSAARANHTGTLLNDGRVLVAGPHASAEIFDPKSGTFIATGSMAGGGRDCCYTATLLADGKVLLVGGLLVLNGGIQTDLATAELWDANTGSWSATGSLSMARRNHTATLLSDGRVLIAGGVVDNPDGTISTLATAEVYDPATGSWSSGGSMNSPRGLHTATLLDSGKVLVAGGDGLAGTAELYDPISGAWRLTGSLLEFRSGHRASLLNDGRVLVTGGLGRFDLATSEIYNPTTEIWSATGSTATTRTEGFTLVRLNNGTLLIAGGGISEAELYDPSAGVWSTTGSMSTDRDYHSATLLVDGRVLVAGGMTTVCDPNPDFGCYTIYLDSAEVYTPVTLGLPTVSITAPAVWATVAGTITVSATATDNVAVGGVQFKLDGANLGAEVIAPPYVTSWNTALSVNGAHTLGAVARDTVGNIGTATPVYVTVLNDTTPPSISITAPASGSSVAGTVAVAASATDDVGVVGVQFKLDGGNLGAEVIAAPYVTLWNTTLSASGTHVLSAVARDAVGNASTALPVSVTVDNVPPSVSITAPASGATVSGTITVSASATDNVGVVGVQFKLDGANLGAEVTTAPYAISWNSASVSNAVHTLTAVARDAAGNASTSSAATVRVRNHR